MRRLGRTLAQLLLALAIVGLYLVVLTRGQVLLAH